VQNDKPGTELTVFGRRDPACPDQHSDKPREHLFCFFGCQLAILISSAIREACRKRGQARFASHLGSRFGDRQNQQRVVRSAAAPLLQLIQ
jgi:hypothetical protein